MLKYLTQTAESPNMSLTSANTNQVKNFMKIHIHFFIIVLSLLILSADKLKAQENDNIINYSDRTTYEIGGINIVGAENRDRNAIKSITGLREGGKIQIPGQA